jgi:hypothetical protein
LTKEKSSYKEHHNNKRDARNVCFAVWGHPYTAKALIQLK